MYTSALPRLATYQEGAISTQELASKEFEATYFMRMFAMQRHAMEKNATLVTCLLGLHPGPVHINLGVFLTGLQWFHMVATYQIRPPGGISASGHPLTSC